mgnify:FL=1
MKESNQYYLKYDKNFLRQILLSRSRILPFDEDSENLQDSCINYLESIKYSRIAIYSPTKYEININKIFNYLLEKNKQVFFPKVIDQDIQFFSVESKDDLSTGSFNILELRGNTSININDINIFIVPCLAIDMNNRRIGYGKGYYDRALKNVEEDKLISLLSYHQYLPFKNTEEYDLRIGNIFINNSKGDFYHEFN